MPRAMSRSSPTGSRSVSSREPCSPCCSVRCGRSQAASWTVKGSRLRASRSSSRATVPSGGVHRQADGRFSWRASGRAPCSCSCGRGLPVLRAVGERGREHLIARADARASGPAGRCGAPRADPAGGIAGPGAAADRARLEGRGRRKELTRSVGRPSSPGVRRSLRRPLNDRHDGRPKPRIQVDHRAGVVPALTETDIEEAVAVAESRPDPASRAAALMQIADALPAAQRGRGWPCWTASSSRPGGGGAVPFCLAGRGGRALV